MVAYGQSNAARAMFVKELARKLKDKGVRVYSIDPGGMKTLTLFRTSSG